MVKKIILMVLILSGIAIASAKAEMKRIGNYAFDTNDKRSLYTDRSVFEAIADVENAGKLDYFKYLGSIAGVISDETLSRLLDTYGCVAIYGEKKIYVYFETRAYDYYMMIVTY